MEKEMNYVAFDIETTGLNPWYGDVVTCICAKTNTGEEFVRCEQNEKKILLEFVNWIEERAEHCLISFNGKAFDIPFILARYACNEMKPPIHLLTERKHIDLFLMTRQWVSLNSYADILGLKGKTDTGLNAIKLFQDKQYTALKNYCMNDVILTEKVYKITKLLKSEDETIITMQDIIDNEVDKSEKD